jgi:hypothetical protein
VLLIPSDECRNMPVKMMPTLSLLLSFLIFILPIYAQLNTPTARSTARSTTPNATASMTGNWPVKTLFLPIDVPPNLGASIITAVSPRKTTTSPDSTAKYSQAPNATAFAISCLPTWAVPDTDSDCDFGNAVIITEGPSTLVYTMTFQDEYVCPQNSFLTFES